MKYIILVMLGLFVSLSVIAQQSLTLDSCIQAAYNHMLFDEQSKLIEEGRGYAIEGNQYLNFPGLELNGTVTIQNEQLSIPIAIPGFTAPEAPLNFNRLLINFNQAIYNGNLAAKKKLIDSLAFDEQHQLLEIEKVKIKSQVIGVYATLLIIGTNQKILQGHVSVLDKKYAQLKGAVEAGVSTNFKLQILEAERLQLQQRMDELVYNEQSLLSVLSNYTGLDLSSNMELVMPAPELSLTTLLNRPELLLFDTKKDGLEAKKALVANSRLPYVGLFGSVGLGNPGYNVFDTSIRPMAMGGLVVKWSVWDWSKTKSEKAQLVVGQSLLDQQRGRAELAFERELIKQLSEVEKYQKLLASDEAIIEAQKMVSISMSSELSNGTATASDYTSQLNIESSAKLNKELHLIQKMLAILTYNTIKGN